MGVALRASGVTSGVSVTSGNLLLNVGNTEPGRYLAMALMWSDYDGVVPTFLGMDCNGEAMSLLASNNFGVRATNQIYVLPSPVSTGIQSVNVAWSDVASFALMGITWIGVDLANPTGTIVTGTGTSTTPSATVVLNRQGALFTSLRVNYAAIQPTVTPTAGQTKLTEQNVFFDVLSAFLGNVGRVVGTQGGDAYADAWSISASNDWRMISVPLNELQYGCSPGQFLTGG